jgi:plasmid stabilization system protein ParE
MATSSEAGFEIADMVLARITEALHGAAEQPSAYRRRTELQGASRHINVLRYSIFFEELPESSRDLGGGIYVLRVLNSARDIRRTFSATWRIDRVHFRIFAAKLTPPPRRLFSPSSCMTGA